MKIAIVGSGISGLVCAHVLNASHDVTVFEAGDHVGGHTHTHHLQLPSGRVTVDSGFIVYNERTYPNFIGLLDELGVQSRPTSMSFSVRCDRCGLEYSGNSWGSLFARKRNLFRPSYWKFLAEIPRLHEQCLLDEDSLGELETVGEYLRRRRFSTEIAEHYLLPMGAAIWSCPMETFLDFPMRFIVEFFRNHGLLQLRNRPQWRVVTGGSDTYVRCIEERLDRPVRVRAPVLNVRRYEDHVELLTWDGNESFDEVIFATHSDQSLEILSQSDPVEQKVLREFPYSDNLAVLHTDDRQLPRNRSAWSAWNYQVPSDPESRPCVTYWMNLLQHLECREQVCVTLNPNDSIPEDRVLRTIRYSHPVFTTRRSAAERRHGELIRRNRVSWCGAYWGNGFHEDGVNSALQVCEAFGEVPGWASRRPTLSLPESVEAPA